MLSLVSLLLSAATLAAAVPASSQLQSRATNSGKATFYGGNVSGGMCSFSTYSIPSGIYGTALASENWSSALYCGACLKVTGPKGTITAMVVDQCPGCGTNHLDLFENAFPLVGEKNKGIIDVTWEQVDCNVPGAVSLRNKEGTSKFWFAQQVLNAKRPVAKFEVSTDGGKTFSSNGIKRAEYNFFENSSGYGTDTVDVRLTDIAGKQIVFTKVGVASGTTIAGSTNFA